MTTIGIDARWIFREISGIGTYTQELIREIARIDDAFRYELLFNDPELLDRVRSETGLDKAPRVRCHLLPGGVFSPSSQLRVPSWIRRHGIEVFHSPNYMIPYLAFPRRRPGRVRCVSTIHDLIPLLFPEYTPRAVKTRFFRVFKAVMRETGRRADLLLTVSESSKRDIVAQLGVPPERVVAIPNGVASEYRPAERRASGSRTLLYVGRFDPYKNVQGLLHAFAHTRSLCPDLRLRIVGAPDPRYPEALDTARAMGLEAHIDWLGYVDGPGLVRAYRQADVFALLSLYEGFGLTVLEAMASGTPVVCGNASSLPEVAGDAALLVDPRDPTAAGEAIARILNDTALTASLRQKGIQRAAAFTWERTARATLEAYRAAIGMTP